MVVVGEHFSLAAPADDGAQRLLRGVLGDAVLELVEEAALRRGVTRTLIERAANVRRERP